MSKIKYFFQQSWLLIVASFFFGALIAITNAALSERIAFNEQEKVNRKMRELMPEAAAFEKTPTGAEIAAGKGKVVSADIYKAVDAAGTTIGYAFVAEGSGFQDKIKLVIAMAPAADKFLGYRVLFSNETPGFGSKIAEGFLIAQFVGAPAEKLTLVKTGEAGIIDSSIVAITGATVSSQAVVNIFNTYVQGIKEQLTLKGPTSDAR